MISGRASAEGTLGYSARFPEASAAGFFRTAQGITVSSLGLGTYLGGMDEETDRGYVDAVTAAVGGGINFIDTSLNYRNQRSERAIGIALASAEVRRDELLIATKAGYLVPDAVPIGVLRPEDIAGQMHSLAPAFLADQVERSRANLGLDTIDICYLHNPETQLRYVTPDDFYRRMRAAFVALEELAATGKIVSYGTATWDGYRSGDGLSLVRLEQIAREVAGAHHRFRFIQLPFNLAMTEGFARKTDGRSVLEAAADLGITAVASATLLQARLARDLPPELAARMPGVDTDAQRAIQFTRSTPGITTALVGMSRTAHVEENLRIARVEPLLRDDYLHLFVR